MTKDVARSADSPSHSITQTEVPPTSLERPSGHHAYANDTIKAAVRAFHRDLPGLLKDYAGKWVAYHGAQQVKIGEDSFELYQACYDRGLDLSAFIVEWIEPQTGDSMIMGPGLMEELQSHQD